MLIGPGRTFLLAQLLCLPFFTAVALAAGTGDEIRFNRDIRSILSDNCFSCHGPDKNKRKGKLRLDDRDNAIEKGAIVPGKPDESELVKRLFTAAEEDLMPPPESNKQLTPAQKELFKRWIAQGAKYEPHWAYIKPTRPEVPRVGSAKSEIRNPIDAFILHSLEARGIQPSREADKATLLRRLSLDLIGLPPTPEEVDAFVTDVSPSAYERQVDRLLASPHFGERMAVPWLDLVRFADTVGYHGDQNVNIFPYRDYVIDAFNKNKPFDQFTIEQLAGDLLPNAKVEQRVATGFNRLNMMTREGGAQPNEYLAKYAADRVRTVATTWLGSTMACCECHDHKYDPFSAKDFYSLAAFFADVKQWGVYQDYGYTPNPDLKGWSNDHPFPPELEVASPYLKRRIERLRSKVNDLCDTAFRMLNNDRTKQAAFDQWREESLSFLRDAPNGWATSPGISATITTKNTNGVNDTVFGLSENGQILFGGKPGDRVQVKTTLEKGWLSAIRLELLPHENHGGGIIRGGAKNTSISLRASLKPNGATNETALSFYDAEVNLKEERYANGFAVLGVKDSWKTSARDYQSPHIGVWLLDKPLRVGHGDELIVDLGTAALGCVRISFSPFASEEPLQSQLGDSLLKALETDENAWALQRRATVEKLYVTSTGWDPDALAQYKKLYREILECRNGRVMTLVTEASEPRLMRVLPRGNWQNETGEIVQPATPHFLEKPANSEGRRFTRLDLARWVVSPENPLTARTVVNRLWKQFFGSGICSTVDDLGLQGDPPSHPELLDWLAVEFIESGWNLKHMVKLMVTSSTYQQSSNLRPELRDRDSNNRLLASQNPRRLEAEFVRDNALAISGLINLEIGGPSAFPYQPAGYYVNLQFPDRDYIPNNDERQYRRGVYAHWQRTFLQPMLANFDAPSREECTAYRTVSNTPQQALTLLNDPTFVEAARVFAEKLLASGPRSDESRLDLAFQKALARAAKVSERKSLLQFLSAQRAHGETDSEEPRRLLSVGQAARPKDANDVELAAWTEVCRVVLNLHETITVY